MARIRLIVGETSYFADAIHAAGFSITLNSFAADTLQFSVPRAITADKIFADGATLQLYQGTVRMFYGVVRATPVEGSANSERHIVNASGGWWGLEQYTFEQLARRYVGGTIQSLSMSDVRLGRSATGDLLQKCGEVIKDAINFASGMGAMIGSGSIADGPYFPEEDALDLTCAEVVFRVCRWMPDMVSGFDHGTGLLNLSTAATSTVTLDLFSKAYRVLQVDPAARTDLIVPGVRIDYQITSSLNGKNVLSLVRETAGNPNAAGGIKHTMAIRGAGITRMQQVQHIKVAELPASEIDETWWKDHCPDLAAAGIQNLVLEEPNGDVYYGDNELLEGSVQDWMIKGNPGASYQLRAGQTTRTVKASYDQIIDGKTVKVTGRVYTARITTTDATSRSYSRVSETLSGGEYYPSGLAASLYAAGSKTWWDGQIILAGPECMTGIMPGMAVNVINGRAEWATMGARITAVRHDLDTGRTTIQVGPPRQMTLGDLADQLRRNRRRQTPTSTGSRLNPNIDDASDLPRIELSSHPPRKTASSGMALLGEETSIITDIRLDTATDALQVKKRKGYVVWSEAAPDWADVENWEAINCDEV